MKFTHKLLRRICTDYGILVPEVRRGTPSTFSSVESGAEGCCIYNWRGDRCLIVSKRTTDLDIMLHELAHAIVGPGHGHDQSWNDVMCQINIKYASFDPRTGQHI